MKNDIAYNNVDFIPDGASYPDRWEADARAYREREAAVGRARLNQPYGEGERQRLDVFYPSSRPEGVLVFVHGGYWLKFHRNFWSHFSQGLTQRGWAVAMPSYTLAPDAQIHQITREIARAIEAAAALVPGPVRLSGHSAGGHLASRVLCRDVVLAPEVKKRVARSVPISPVSDLRPLLKTSMNSDLQLDPAEAAAESPVLHPSPKMDIHTWVGAEERPVFLDQARWLQEAWGTELTIAKGKHHFDVIAELSESDAPLIRALLKP